MRSSRLPAPILVITDRSQACLPLVEVIEAAFVGGCRWLSLREKDWTSNDRLSLVHELLPMARRFGATILVHGDIDVAKHADGVHLPSGANVEVARARLGSGAIVGLSCHTVHDVRFSSGVDYVTLGPFAPTASKPGLLPSLDADALRAASGFGIPIVALGGVDETNLARWKRAGASGIAVMGGVMRSADPAAVVRGLVDAWETA